MVASAKVQAATAVAPRIDGTQPCGFGQRRGDPDNREYGTCAWPGLAELRLRPLAKAPSGSGAGRIVPGVADASSAALPG